MSLDEAFNLAQTLHRGGRIGEAAQLFRRILEIKPGHVDALHYLGVCLSQQGAFEAAIPYFQALLRLMPKHADALSNMGNALQGLGRYQEALACYDEALVIKPGNAVCQTNRGNVLKALARYEEAMDSYAKALAIRPDHANSYFNRGTVLHELKRAEEALRDFDKALSLHPGHVQAYCNRGIVLHEQGYFDRALADFDKAIMLDPSLEQAYVNRAGALLQLRRLDEALASCDRAIQLNPGLAEAYVNRGSVLLELKRFEAALASCDRAIGLEDRSADAHVNRGHALKELGRLEEALASCDRALSLNPDSAEAHAIRGSVLIELKRHEDALVSFDLAVSINPDLPYLLGNWLRCKTYGCIWTDIDKACQRVATAIADGQRAASPFIALSFPTTLSQQMMCARTYTLDKHPAGDWRQARQRHSGHDRIRIGYFSADYHNHATAYLISELMECHDRGRFEIQGFSFGPDARDPCRQRLENTFDRFHDVRLLSDGDVAELARGLEIDIAVDLKGLTQDARPGIFARRPAPIQVNYLGYPGTMGVEFMDYILADAIVVPTDHARYYTEKIVHLPHCYQANDSTKVISEQRRSRAELGLPEQGFVFCCFNNNYKITPDVFDIWMRLLRKVDGSVLWLLEDNPVAAGNLRGEARQRGIDPARLVFAPRMELGDHLARHRQADLFLDTFYYNAHTTGSDALWSGLPMLTCLGDTFAGRVGASLLSAIGLPEMITRNHAEYEALALALATEPERLAAIRKKLAGHRATFPLFDTPLFTRHIEAAYLAMYARHQAGLPADYLKVEA